MKHCTQCGAEQPGDARFCPRCGTPVAAGATSSDAMLGKVVAERYLLVERIGQGGSGTIYRGEHTTLRKKVAVKILHHQLSQDDTAVERFRREATTVGEIDNDHILQVLDFGRTDDKRLFFAMEFLEGESLTKVIERERHLSVPRVVDVLVQVGEALMEAHALGYIHRDLRPRNIFLTTRRGKADFVKLLDFGLAKLILPDQPAKATAMGMTFGDPRYMSPEQARGEQVDRRADIYSLGVIAYEMLTGNAPYAGSGTFDVLQKHLEAPVPKVRAERAECPEWLDLTVQRALAKRPDDRFLTVLKLIECLRGEKAPAAVDPAERDAHAQLSQGAQLKAVADAFGGPAAKVEEKPHKETAPQKEAAPEKREPSAKETQAIGTIPARKPGMPAQPSPATPDAPVAQASPATHASATQTAAAAKPAPATPAPAQSAHAAQTASSAQAAQSAAAKPSQQQQQQKSKKNKRDSGRAAAIPMASTRSGETRSVAPIAGAGASAASTPSVVIEGATPVAIADNDPTVPVTKLPQPLPLPPPPEGKQKDPTGEWFEQNAERAPGGTSYDDFDDEMPRKNRAPLIIGGVAGGLTVVVFAIILLLPKPAHKKLRGEAPDEPAQPTATAQKPPEPAPAVPPAPLTPKVTPLAVNPAPTVPSTPVAPTPAPAAVAATPNPAASTAPTANLMPKPAPVVAKIEPKPEPPKVEPPKPAPVAAKVEPKPEPPKPAPVVAKVEPKPEKARPEHADKTEKPEKPAKAEKPVKLASAEPRKHDDTPPPGFKDPFADPKTQKAAPAQAAQADFFIKLGRQKLNSSDLAGAAANFNKAREYDGRSPEAFAGLGEVAFEQGDYNGAAVQLKQALRLSPNKARYLILLGQAFYKLGKARDAVTEYKKALRVDPNNQEAQHSLEVAERKLAQGG